jgi:RimJ/RimL family protein N-acetyltransferase
VDYAILPIAQEHIDGFHAALDRVARERKYLLYLEAPSLEKTREFILGNIRDRNPQYVAVSGERVIGWCDVVRNPREASRHCGILGIAVVPEHRGQGVGRRLMTTVIDAAWARDFTRIELGVREDNLTAIALYRNLGFAIEGVRRKAIRIDGQYEDVVTMALLKENGA